MKMHGIIALTSVRNPLPLPYGLMPVTSMPMGLLTPMRRWISRYGKIRVEITDMPLGVAMPPSSTPQVVPAANRLSKKEVENI